MKKDAVRLFTAAAAGAMTLACASGAAQKAKPESFEEVVSFVNQHSKLVVLSDPETKASIAVWPAMQGRVLTSSAAGLEGYAFGWFNQDLIASGKFQEHFTAVGGEDRIWIGPEGGQFSVFFAPGSPFDLQHWYTPAPLDKEPFQVVNKAADRITLRKDFQLKNYSGTEFQVRINRTVLLLDRGQIWRDLGLSPMNDVRVVGYESENTLVNRGSKPWIKKTGLLSLWVLGQFQANSGSTIILPIRAGSTAKLGIPVTTDYFGPVPKDRIAIHPAFVLLKADGHFRSKLGVSPQRSKGVLGSYDRLHHVLTIVQYSQPPQVTDYVNSAWKIQKDPYHGDVANCYNDGPPAPGQPQLGQFYELESSSPAMPLAPGQTVEHTHRTIHIEGPEQSLDTIAKALLGVNLQQVNAFNP